MASVKVDVDEKAARAAAEDRYWDHHRRQRQCGVPFRDDWVPWGRLWWVTLDACRDWYRAASTTSSAKIDRSHPRLRQYTQALAYLKNQHWENWSWYNGTEIMMVGEFYSLAWAVFGSVLVVHLSFPEIGQAAGIWLSQLTRLSHHSVQTKVAYQTASLKWQIVAWAVAIGAWGNIARHAFATWWVAGLPWWPATRRVERLLQRFGNETTTEALHD